MTENETQQSTPQNTSDKTAKILAEAQRRLEEKQHPVAPDKSVAGRGWKIAVNRGVYWLSKHWISLFNALTALYTLGAVLAPFFILWSMPGAAKALYAFYDPFCHQLPFRSFFVGGEHAVYPLEHDPGGLEDVLALSSDNGDAVRGYKMALCERDIAIYGVMVLAGIAYGISRRVLRRPLKPLPLWLVYIFFIMPMMLDGGLQWLTYTVLEYTDAVFTQPFETIPAMRVLTGALFGFGMVWVLYPYMDEFFVDTKSDLEAKFGW